MTSDQKKKSSISNDVQVSNRRGHSKYNNNFETIRFQITFGRSWKSHLVTVFLIVYLMWTEVKKSLGFLNL